MPAPLFTRPSSLKQAVLSSAWCLLVVLGTALGLTTTLDADAQTQKPPTPATSEIDNSKLDAALFYQLLIGEIELRSGEAGTAYQVLLDAARKSKDSQLFRRATEIGRAHV